MVRAHLGPLNNQPLTIYFVGGFFFVASFLPGFEEKVGGSLHLSWFYSNNDKRNRWDSSSLSCNSISTHLSKPVHTTPQLHN